MAGTSEVFHSFRQADYVTVLAVTQDERVPVVRQYRPALDQKTLELPGGLRDEGEEPIACAIRELWEETGLRVYGSPVALPSLAPDPGRLENVLWPFFMHARGPSPDWRPERGVEALLLTVQELADAITAGHFSHAGHLGIVAHALFDGYLRLDQ